MEYNEELHQAITTLKMGLAQLEKYLSNKDLEYHDRFSVIENELDKNNKTKAKILERCWVLDENNQKKAIGDEKHIYRYSVYEAILEKIADYIIVNYEISTKAEVLYYLYKRTGLAVYINEEYKQAEIIKTMFRPLKERLKIHISLLRGLKKGLEIEQAVEISFRELYPDVYNSLKWMLCNHFENPSL